MARIKSLPPRMPSCTGRQMGVADSTSWRAGKTTAEKGYGGWWQRHRLIFLKANPLCRYCQRIGLVVMATVVDHIIPHRGDQILFRDQSNWQPLCKTCHDIIKKSEESAPK